MFGPWIGPRRLNVGCAGNREPGFVNLDKNPGVGADVTADMADMPFGDGSFDTILASHVLEHVEPERLFRVFAEFHRVLAPGGHLIAITPHGASDDSWENPHHRQRFTPTTFAYFTEALYSIPGNAGHLAAEGQPVRGWRIVLHRMVAHDCTLIEKLVPLSWRAKFLRNVVKEVQVVMRRD